MLQESTWGSSRVARGLCQKSAQQMGAIPVLPDSLLTALKAELTKNSLQLSWGIEGRFPIAVLLKQRIITLTSGRGVWLAPSLKLPYN